MCGRYRRRSDKQRIAEAFHVGMGLEDLYLEPDDDIAPGSMQPVVSTSEEGEREIALMRWGFKLPGRLIFNARSEGIDQARFWKDSFQQRRCIVPADAIFEWQKVARGKKPKAIPESLHLEAAALKSTRPSGSVDLPQDHERARQLRNCCKYEISIPGREPFGMAGIWKFWKNPKTNQLERTFSVLTGAPNELIEPIHDRLATILDPRDYEEYLVPAERAPVHLLRIVPPEQMKVTRIEETKARKESPGLFDLTQNR